MLEFTHRSAENEKSLHIWPYVYFHGEAERMNDKAFAEGGDAPDISIANEPMENYMLMKTWMGELHGMRAMGLGVPVMALPCTVGGKPAVVVLATRKSADSFALTGGRIALVSDVEAMRHAYDVANWH